MNSMTTGRIAGRVALITGAGRGIGRGIAEALAARGWWVGINYRRDEAAAQETLAAVKRLGGDGACLRADVARLEQHAGLIQAVLEATGRLDVLVNNAGMAPRQRADMLHMLPESYDEVMQTNLKGPFFLTQAAAQALIELRAQNRIAEAKIINITSISAATVSTNRAEYCLSKAGLAMMTQLWAARLAEYGILVYEIRPGVIETDMTAGVHEKYDHLIYQEGRMPIARWGSPEDIGKAVTAIVEGLFPYSTGEVLHVDGGFHISRL